MIVLLLTIQIYIYVMYLAPSSPSISPPRSRPSTPQRVTSSNEQLGKMFKGKNPLVKAEHQSQLSMLHLLSARNEFGKLIARLPKSVGKLITHIFIYLSTN